MADLTHTDWLLFSQQALIQQLDPTITTNIINSDVKNYLVVSNLTKTNLAQIRLITNTDRNNNYLYLDGFNVYVGDSPTPIKIPGIEEMMKNLCRFSDANAFVLGGKTHLPFAASNLSPANPPAGGAYADMDAFLTVFSTTVPKSVCANLGGKQLRYELILNPDAITGTIMAIQLRNGFSYDWGYDRGFRYLVGAKSGRQYSLSGVTTNYNDYVLSNGWRASEGTGTSKLYVNGKLFSGIYNNLYYSSGTLLNGTYKFNNGYMANNLWSVNYNLSGTFIFVNGVKK